MRIAVSCVQLSNISYLPRQNWAPTGLSVIIKVIGLPSYGEWWGVSGPPGVSNPARDRDILTILVFIAIAVYEKNCPLLLVPLIEPYAESPLRKIITSDISRMLTGRVVISLTAVKFEYPKARQRNPAPTQRHQYSYINATLSHNVLY